MELGIYGCPDRWVLQVNEAGVLRSRLSVQKRLHIRVKGLKYLEILPDAIAAMLLAEHANLAAPYMRL